MRYLKVAGVNFELKKTTFDEIFWTIAEMIFFKFINLLPIDIRSQALNGTRKNIIKLMFSSKK